MRNPNWTTDELILALDLYFQAGRKWLDDKHPNVIQLSALLNKLPIHVDEERHQDFRNPQGVSMKLGNFLALDPQYQGTGLQRGGKLDAKVWDEFSHDLPRLHATAIAISQSATASSEELQETNETTSEDNEDEFPEGKILTRLHKRKERNRKATEQKKRKLLKETGNLICEACDFDFVLVYGQLGYGFAECHHTLPVAALTADHRTRLADLAILCANCHRMIHRSRPILTVEALRKIILGNRHTHISFEGNQA